jgi:CheY-like chemotaxis protein
MIRLLMLDLDSLLVAAIGRTLLQEGMSLENVRSAELACRRVVEGNVDVALLDFNLINRADFACFAKIPVVLMTSFLESEEEHPFFRGARLLRKPFTSAQLLMALREALGPLHSEPVLLVDLLLRAHTCGLSVAFRVGSAEVFVENGELVHAEFGKLRGEAALAAILGDSQNGPLSIPSRSVEHTIARPFRTTLFDALGAVDEREQLLAFREPLPHRNAPRGGTES